MEEIEIPQDLSQILVLALPFNSLTFLKGTLRIHQKNDNETVFIKVTLPGYKLAATHFSRNILQYGNQTITFKRKSVRSLIKTDCHEFVKESVKEEGRIEDIKFNSKSCFFLSKDVFNSFNSREELSKFVEFEINFDTSLLEMKSEGISVKVKVEGYGVGTGRFSLLLRDLKYLVGLLNVFENCKVFLGTEGVFNFVFQATEIHVSCFIVGL